MPLDSQHPSYMARTEAVTLMTDAYAGEPAIKGKSQKYLPFCASHILDGVKASTDLGYINYTSYKSRAIFPDYTKDAIEKSLGMMHQKEASVFLPPGLEYLRATATADGDSLQHVIRKINFFQLLEGRAGLLADLPKIPDPTAPQFYLTVYSGGALINWHERGGSAVQGSADVGQLDLVVINESAPAMNDDFQWNDSTLYRVLRLSTDGGKSVYKMGEFTDTGYDDARLSSIMYRGVVCEQLPFSFINVSDVNAQPSDPPLAGLARQCVSIYRSEADYRQSLHMQGQDTLITIGDENDVTANGEIVGVKQTRVGAGARISLEKGGDAKYIGVSPTGISEQRAAITNDRRMAAIKTVEIGQPTGEVESGASREMRIAAETASLTQIALSGAAGLEKVLKRIAKWVGEDDSLVKVTPNLEFAKAKIDGQAIVNLTTAKNIGFPISNKSLHTYGKQRGLSELTFEQEVEEISAEEPLIDTTLDTGSI